MADEPSTRPDASYGTTRVPGVSYIEVEHAAIALLKAGQRPSVERLRQRLGRGSPQTLLSALQRFWRDLGTRIEGDPAALTRLPAEIAGLTDAVWQRALALAADAAAQREGTNLERLEFLKRENELKAHAISLRERELDAQLRAREKTVAELQEHLNAAMTFVARQNATIEALERRLTAAEAEAHQHRQRLATIVTRAIARKRASRNPPRRIRAGATQTGKRRRAASRKPPRRTRRSPRG